MSGTLPAVHTLPDEILDLIFTMGCQHDIEFGLNASALGDSYNDQENWLPDMSTIISEHQHTGARRPNPFIQVARLVCKRWYEICAQSHNGHMWISSVDLTSDHDWTTQFAIGKERLLRSQNCNLDITIYFGYSSPEENHLPSRTRLCLHFWRLLLNYKNQWRFLRLQTGIPAVLGVILHDLSKLKHAPRLLWISINDEGNGFESGYYQPDVSNPSLHLYVDPLPMDAAPAMSVGQLNGLVHLSTQAIELPGLVLPPGLRSLSLVTWQVGAARKILPWNELLNTLEHGQSLRRLDICLMDISDIPSYPPDSEEFSLSLDCLRSIHIEGMLPQLLMFLRVIKMPQLETINVTFFGESTSDMRIEPLIINSFPKLTRIATKHTEVHEMMFLSMLTMPSLHSVDLRLYWQSNNEFVWPEHPVILFPIPEELRIVNAKPTDFYMIFQDTDLSNARSFYIGPSSTIPGHGSSGTVLPLKHGRKLHCPKLHSLFIISPPLSDLGGYLLFLDAPALRVLCFEKMAEVGDPGYEDWMGVCQTHQQLFRNLTKVKFYCPQFNYEYSSTHRNPFSFFPSVEDMDVQFRSDQDLAWLEPPVNRTREGKRKRKKFNPPLFSMMKKLRNLTITILTVVVSSEPDDPVFKRIRKIFEAGLGKQKGGLTLTLYTRSFGAFEVEESLRLESSH